MCQFTFTFILLPLLFQVHLAVSLRVVSRDFQVFDSHAGVGEILEVLQDETLTSCVCLCSGKINCTSINFSESEKTCELLNVADVTLDWVSRENTVYVCNGCEAGLQGE